MMRYALKSAVMVPVFLTLQVSFCLFLSLVHPKMCCQAQVHNMKKINACSCIVCTGFSSFVCNVAKQVTTPSQQSGEQKATRYCHLSRMSSVILTPLLMTLSLMANNYMLFLVVTTR